MNCAVTPNLPRENETYSSVVQNLNMTEQSSHYKTLGGREPLALENLDTVSVPSVQEICDTAITTRLFTPSYQYSAFSSSLL